MNARKLLIPLLFLVACKGEEEACLVDVRVTDTNQNPLPETANVTLDVDGEPCEGGPVDWTCTLLRGEPNQLTGWALPGYSPKAVRGPEIPEDEKRCPEFDLIEVRLQKQTK